jgi:hypothetical protein
MQRRRQWHSVIAAAVAALLNLNPARGETVGSIPRGLAPVSIPVSSSGSRTAIGDAVGTQLYSLVAGTALLLTIRRRQRLDVRLWRCPPDSLVWIR